MVHSVKVCFAASLHRSPVICLPLGSAWTQMSHCLEAETTLNWKAVQSGMEAANDKQFNEGNCHFVTITTGIITIMMMIIDKRVEKQWLGAWQAKEVKVEHSVEQPPNHHQHHHHHHHHHYQDYHRQGFWPKLVNLGFFAKTKPDPAVNRDQIHQVQK